MHISKGHEQRIGRHPQEHTTVFLVPLSTKYTLRIRNLCAQHDTVAESKKCHTVTCVRVNAIRTILQFTLVTHGHLFRVKLGATKGTNIPIITHNILIIIVLLCRCGPYMCRYVFPWTKEGEQNQKSKPRPRVTMMHHATKRGFKDCPGFLNSTGRLGPKRGRKCYVTPAFSGVPKRRGTKSEVKT